MLDTSPYLKKKMLDHVLRGTAYAAPANVYLGLFDSSEVEISGGGYVRKMITFSAPSSEGVIKNSADVIFDMAKSGWGRVTHFGIFDAEASGNLLIYGQLENSKTIQSGDRIQFGINGINVYFS